MSDSASSDLPVILLTFAQDRSAGGEFLGNLLDQERRLQEAFQKHRPPCEVIIRNNITVGGLVELF